MEGSVEDDSDHGAPAVRREILRPNQEVAGGVVHQRRERAERLLGSVEGGRDGVVIANVRLHREAITREARDGGVQWLTPSADDGHLRTESPELERHGAPEAAAAAGDERDAAGQSSVGEH